MQAICRCKQWISFFTPVFRAKFEPDMHKNSRGIFILLQCHLYAFVSCWEVTTC